MQNPILMTILMFWLPGALLGQTYEEQVARWTALSSSVNALERADVSGPWDLSASVAPEAFQQYLQHYQGTVVRANQGFGKKVGLSVALEEISFSTGADKATGELALKASTTKPALTFSFVGTLELEFSRYEELENDERNIEAVFMYRVVDVRPNYTFWQRVRRLFGGFVDQITEDVGNIVTEQLNKNNALEVRVRLPQLVSLPLTVDEVDQIEFKKGDSVIGTVDHRISTPPKELARKLTYLDPVISEGGVTIFAFFGSIHSISKSSSPPTPENIAEEILALEESIEAAIEIDLPSDADFQIQLAPQVGVSLVNELAALPDEQRSLTLETVSASGMLLDFRGRDKIFGRFGIKAHTKGSDTIRGLGKLESIGATIDGEGIVLSASATASARAIAEVVWDGFIIKNALSFDISLDGKASAHVRAPLKMRTHQASGLSGALWGLDFECSVFIAELSTSEGNLFGAIPVSFEEIRGSFPVTLFKERNRADLILDSRPTRTMMFPFVPPEEVKDQNALIESNTNFVEYRTVPKFAGFENGHYVVRGNLESTSIKLELEKIGDDFFDGDTMLGGDWFSESQRIELDEAEEALSEYEFEDARACPSEPAARYEILGLNFGPDGEVMKFITAGLETEEQKLEAVRSLLEGDLEEAGEHLTNALKAEADKHKAAIDAALKAIEDAIPDKPEDLLPTPPTKPEDLLNPGGILNPGGVVGGVVGGILSDMRLKTVIAKVGVLTDGINLYKFSYLGSSEEYLGVLAQEVLLERPDAVYFSDTGLMYVNYDLLGFEMKRWNPSQ